jgi:hypothetical protein
MKETIQFMDIEYKDFGSLDCPCDFCNKNSYGKNFHFIIDRIIKLVICEECLKEIKENSK